MPHFLALVPRRLVALAGALCACLLLAACSSSPTPETVVRDFINAAANNRVEEAIGYFSLEGVKGNDLTAAKGKLMMVVGDFYSRIEGNGGLDSVSTSLAENKDNTARVEAVMKFKNGQTKKERFDLIQESGQWKIHLE